MPSLVSTRSRGTRRQSAALGAALLACAASSVSAQAPAPAGTPPFSLEAVYTADLWHNLHGGIRRDAVYLDNLDLVAEFDGERLLGLARTSFVVSALYNNRRTLSERVVGDLQTVSNIDTDGALRLYEAWAEHRAGNAAAKMGLIDLNSEFDVIETGGLFLNSSHGIGPDFSQIGENGPGIFPITALGGRLSYQINDRIELRVGVFEGVAGDPARPRRTLLRLRRGEGVTMVGEANYRPRDGLRVALGTWRHDIRNPDPAGRRRIRTSGGYSIVEARLGSFAGQPLHGFARVGVADGSAHPIASYQGAGLTLGDPDAEPGGPGQFGLAVASAVTSRTFRAEQALMGARAERRETAIELTYRLRPRPWLAIQPDVQYVINPGAVRGLRNALVAGLRIEIGWSSAD